MTTTSIQRLLLGLCVALALDGCVIRSTEGAIFACERDGDCASDELCLEQICRSKESLADGGPIVGNCATSCAAERKMCCGTTCVDVGTDDANCGTCGRQCAAGESCVAGQCAKELSCDNARDDNDDGLVDCEDELSCPAATPCAGGGRCCNATCAVEATHEACSNGVDDDCDGKIDCEEETCLGRQCASGAVCAEGACAAGCFIDGKFVAQGAANPNSPCLACNANQNLRDWTAVPTGSLTDGCKGARACNGDGYCRRSSGQPCGGHGDCASKQCLTGFCR